MQLSSRRSPLEDALDQQFRSVGPPAVGLGVVLVLVGVVFLDGNGDLHLVPNQRLRRTPATMAAMGRYSCMLTFQRLHVYQRAIEFLSLSYDIVAELPRGNADRADQLTRSAESVVRNIAEG